MVPLGSGRWWQHDPQHVRGIHSQRVLTVLTGDFPGGDEAWRSPFWRAGGSDHPSPFEQGVHPRMGTSPVKQALCFTEGLVRGVEGTLEPLGSRHLGQQRDAVARGTVGHCELGAEPRLVTGGISEVPLKIGWSGDSSPVNLVRTTHPFAPVTIMRGLRVEPATRAPEAASTLVT